MAKLLAKPESLYGICDQQTCELHGIAPEQFCQALATAGVKIIQYRNKTSEKDAIRANYEQILSQTRDFEICFILNDHADIAIEFATAVHLGQDDGKPPEQVLALDFEFGDTEASELHNRIAFGRSTHSLSEIDGALNENILPDYIGFGAMFQSPTKRNNKLVFDLLPQAMKKWQGDLVLIGGITSENIEELPKASNIYYAIITDFFHLGKSPKMIEKQAKLLLSKCI